MFTWAIGASIAGGSCNGVACISQGREELHKCATGCIDCQATTGGKPLTCKQAPAIFRPAFRQAGSRKAALSNCRV